MSYDHSHVEFGLNKIIIYLSIRKTVQIMNIQNNSNLEKSSMPSNCHNFVELEIFKQ